MEPVCEFHSRFAHVRISDGSIDSRIFNLWVAHTLVSSCASLTYHFSCGSHSHVRRNVYLDILCTARLPAHCSTLLSCRVYRKMLEQLDYCPIMKYSYVSGWCVLHARRLLPWSRSLTPTTQDQSCGGLCSRQVSLHRSRMQVPLSVLMPEEFQLPWRASYSVE